MILFLKWLFSKQWWLKQNKLSQDEVQNLNISYKVILQSEVSANNSEKIQIDLYKVGPFYYAIYDINNIILQKKKNKCVQIKNKS